MRLVIIVAAVAMLAGCSSVAPVPKEAKAVPAMSAAAQAKDKDLKAKLAAKMAEMRAAPTKEAKLAVKVEVDALRVRIQENQKAGR